VSFLPVRKRLHERRSVTCSRACDRSPDDAPHGQDIVSATCSNAIAYELARSERRSIGSVAEEGKADRSGAEVLGGECSAGRKRQVRNDDGERAEGSDGDVGEVH
jgi:hypothetical protein